jgi:hypothetical protein
MEIPRIRLLMQGLHALESGMVSPRRVSEIGFAHAVSEARSKRIGLTAEEVAEKFMKYSNQRDAEREGILVIGLITSVKMEHVG